MRREITRIMINDFKIKELGHDFMGFTIDKLKDLSFHHTIYARRNCRKLHIPNDGYIYTNGSILVQDTSHEELHLAEKYDPEIFRLITSELIDENIKRRIDIENLKKIRELLLYFESEHRNTKNGNGLPIIKPKYIEKRIKL